MGKVILTLVSAILLSTSYTLGKEYFLMREEAYNILGIKKGDNVSKAYKDLAKKYHPDLGNKSNKMSEINVAYEFLTEKRFSKKYKAALKRLEERLIEKMNEMDRKSSKAFS